MGHLLISYQTSVTVSRHALSRGALLRAGVRCGLPALLSVRSAHSFERDLRDNVGGLLAQAAAVADRFLEEGVIVITESAAEGREQKVAQHAQTQLAYPMVVLQNAVSASASEIVSGALQKLDRAVIVGERSAGAGTVQLVFSHLDPKGAALKLTIAQFLLAGDRTRNQPHRRHRTNERRGCRASDRGRTKGRTKRRSALSRADASRQAPQLSRLGTATTHTLSTGTDPAPSGVKEELLFASSGL